MPYSTEKLTKETILKVFRYDKNAFILGCGRETMQYKFFEVTRIWYQKNHIRRSIEKYFKPIRKYHEYTRFIMN